MKHESMSASVIPSTSLASFSTVLNFEGTASEKVLSMLTLMSLASVLSGMESHSLYSSRRSRPWSFHQASKASLVGTIITPAS